MFPAQKAALEKLLEVCDKIRRTAVPDPIEHRKMAVDRFDLVKLVEAMDEYREVSLRTEEPSPATGTPVRLEDQDLYHEDGYPCYDENCTQYHFENP